MDEVYAEGSPLVAIAVLTAVVVPVGKDVLSARERGRALRVPALTGPVQRARP